MGMTYFEERAERQAERQGFRRAYRQSLDIDLSPPDRKEVETEPKKKKAKEK